MADRKGEGLSSQSFARHAERTAKAVISILLACLFGLMGVLRLWSRGKPDPFAGEDGSPPAGSISEKIHVDINGVKQGMIIQSRDESNPVLLFLHGGPGMPEYFLTQNHPTGLEVCFTVCWWEQRGSGLSFSRGIPPETMTVEQFVADTLAVTNYLRRRFSKEKIYLIAHSGGTFFGIQAAAQAPELYHAYIGVAQISYQLKSEKLAYEYMLKRFKEIGSTRMVRRLKCAPVTMTAPLPKSYLALRDKAMHRLGIGTTHAMKSVISGIFFPVWQCRAYTVREKANIWSGKRFSRACLWDTLIATDLTKQLLELGLPVYFFHGIYDYTASYTEAKSYFETLRAPLKGFYTFEQSAHSPIFEEPERVLKFLREDVLLGAIGLADATPAG